LTAHGGIWQQTLAHLVLSKRERRLWDSLHMPEPRRLEWLLGRVVAKDALRSYLEQRYGMILCPADLEILPGEYGRPLPQGAWSRDIARVPLLSLSHVDGVAVALVGDSDTAAGVGVDVEHVGRMREETARLTFTPGEQALLASIPNARREDWPLRLWCAKEAVAKALGRGAVGGPPTLVIEQLAPDTGMVQVRLTGEMARRFPGATKPIVASTAREGDLIVAVSLYPLGEI